MPSCQAWRHVISRVHLLSSDMKRKGSCHTYSMARGEADVGDKCIRDAAMEKGTIHIEHRGMSHRCHTLLACCEGP